MSLVPIKFHEVHGENIELLNDGSAARRIREFGGALCFSDRPLTPGEILRLKVVDTCEVVDKSFRCFEPWSGALRLGVVGTDPRTMEGSLPRFLCPDLNTKARTWGKAVSSEDMPLKVYEDIWVYFDETCGRVLIGKSLFDLRDFISGVATREPLYLVFDVYGNTKEIEVSSSIENPESIRLPMSGAKFPGSKYFGEMRFIPASFATRETENLSVSPHRAHLLAYSKKLKENFAVTETPLMSRCALVIGIHGVRQAGPMRVVLTTEIPESVHASGSVFDLCASSDTIILETETTRELDEFAVAISKNGGVYLCFNNGRWRERGQVDPELKYYAAFDLINVSRIDMIGIATLEW